MLNILFCASALVLMLASFNYSYVLGGVNRAFYGSFKAVAEASVFAYEDSGGEIVPYFVVSLFKKNVEGYFKENLANYVQSYEITCSFSQGPLSYNEDNKFGIASFTLKTELGFSLSYNKTATFTIERNPHE